MQARRWALRWSTASTSRVSLPAPLRSEHEYQRAVAQFGYKVANQVAVGPSRASSTYDSRAAGWRRPNPRSANQSGGIIRDHSAADDVPSYRRGRVESVSIAVDRDWVYFVTAVDSGKASGCGATGAVPRVRCHVWTRRRAPTSCPPGRRRWKTAMKVMAVGAGFRGRIDAACHASTPNANREPGVSQSRLADAAAQAGPAGGHDRLCPVGEMQLWRRRWRCGC